MNKERPLRILDAGIGAVGPFQLDGVVAYLLCFPRAYVADFAVVLIVPSLPWDWVGDGFGQFVGTGGCEGIKCSQGADATLTVGIGHYSVKDLSVNVVVVATECLT